MRKKSGFTIVEQAIVLVFEFEKVVHKLEQQVTVCGQSESTLKNYIQRITLFVVNFGKLPEQIDPDEINEYLAALARDPKSPSRSSFKHMVYGLRYYYRLLGMNKNAIALPSLKGNTKPPVILNHLELIVLLILVFCLILLQKFYTTSISEYRFSHFQVWIYSFFNPCSFSKVILCEMCFFSCFFYHFPNNKSFRFYLKFITLFCPKFSVFDF